MTRTVWIVDGVGQYAQRASDAQWFFRPVASRGRLGRWRPCDAPDLTTARERNMNAALPGD